VGIGLAVLSGGSIVGVQVLVGQANGAIQQTDLLGNTKTTTERKHADIKGAQNIILAGLDTRPSWGTGVLSRTDSIIVLHIPADRSQAQLISLPRDLRVYIPANNNGKYRWNGGYDKLNAAFAWGSDGLSGTQAEQQGFALLAKTITKLTGIKPDAGALVTYGGFKEVVKVLGKVCLYVDEKTTSIHVGHKADGSLATPYTTNAAGQHPRRVPGVKPNVYTKGNHCLDSTEALDFARQRDLLENEDGDYGRQRHQQQLFKAIMQQAVHAGFTNPTKLPKLLDAVGKAVTVDNGGVALEDWVFAMKGINPQDIYTIKTNAGKFHSQTVNGQSVEVLDDTSKQLLTDVKNDTMTQFMTEHPDYVAKS
jgi:anionic cell wall polymer biosynthesis LytR-Cps2A-Psr (LCP) family protein